MTAASGKKPASQDVSGVPDRVAATLALDEDVTKVKLVSPARARALAGLRIGTVRDLLTHFPRRYIDMSNVADIAHAPIGEECTVKAQIYELKHKRARRNLDIVEITLVDETGTLIVTAFRQPWLLQKLSQGMNVAVAGKLEFNYGFKRMTNPHIETLAAGEEAKGVVLPVHPASERVSAQMMRRLVSNALELVDGVLDPLPLDLRLQHGLMARGPALRAIHFPRSMDEQAQARRRLAYEEVLLLELALMREGARRAQKVPPEVHVVNGPHLQALRAAVPFQLTDEQSQACQAVLSRMAASACMNHMVLGDVGTGKTIVAAHALACVADTGTQALLLAPTEILARQHAATLGPLFDAAGITWAVLTGSTAPDEREDIVRRAASGRVDVLVGTHALLEDDVRLPHCSLAVIDEQQRFGVEQRARLLGKGACPDALYLTATPIPRTLALAVYGNLTLSYIKLKPRDIERRKKGIGPRKTYVHTKQEQGRAYDAALAALARGEQVYVVCPLVGSKPAQGKSSAKDKRASARKEGDESYAYASISIESEEDMREDDVAAAQAMAVFLQEKTFIDYKVDLVCGRMSGAEKEAAMDRFRSGETDVLVATTVIEVGVDVPNATVMIIEDADRFGLAQLHQLRGRVGRGDAPGEVHLISGSRSETALSRLAAMEKTDDGFELAEFDLSLRREGDILGNRQSGASGLKLVNVVRDGRLIEAAHADAQALLAADPDLSQEANRALAREARIMFPTADEVTGG